MAWRKILFLGVYFLANPVLAAESLAIAGAEVSGHRNAYGQLGVITPLPGNTLGDGFVARGVVSGVTYQYEGAPGTVDGDALGGELMLGYQQSGAPGWWAFYTGPVVRYTELSPNDPGSDADGTQAGWGVQGEAERFVTDDFKVNFGASYALMENNPFWTRIRLLYRIERNIFAGSEGTYQGDRDYRAWSAGAVVTGIPLTDKADLGFKAGVRKTEDLSLSPYGGVELGWRF